LIRDLVWFALVAAYPHQTLEVLGVKGRVNRAAVVRLTAAGAAVLLMAAGCGVIGGGDAGPDEGAAGPRVTVSPAPGATAVPADTPVRVSVDEGSLTDVAIEQMSEGEVAETLPVTGTLSEDGTTWVSDWNLVPGTAVTVYAVAEGASGRQREVRAEFTTAPVGEERSLGLESNFPASGDVVGVGMPVVVTFDTAVQHKEQVENSIEVTSEHPVEGAWNWVTDETAVFRPREYWEPYQDVTVDLRLAGVQAAEGVRGTEDHRLEFEVGREMISTMHVPDHEMEVTVDGETVRTIPVSNGKGHRRFNTTTSGVHVLMEKYARLVMDSATVGIPKGSPGYYRLDVDWAVRTSNSGEFTHAAPWNAGNLGVANASNGCTNMSVSDARWFHDQALMGDILETTGTDRELEWDNGWGFYQRSWEEWLDHSVTGEPQVTDGSGTPGSVHGEGL
jgi:lipoprotein-anchoring transpeptidase ErfK/SrfK